MGTSRFDDGQALQRDGQELGKGYPEQRPGYPAIAGSGYSARDDFRGRVYRQRSSTHNINSRGHFSFLATAHIRTRRENGARSARSRCSGSGALSSLTRNWRTTSPVGGNVDPPPSESRATRKEVSDRLGVDSRQRPISPVVGPRAPSGRGNTTLRRSASAFPPRLRNTCANF
jgi:hypothetical protein